MPAKKLKDFLDKNNIRYVTINHSPAYTAQGIAHIAHISGKELAKTVILKADGKLVMAVLPATHKVNLDAFRKATGAQSVELAEERDFEHTFPGCELGAMPPFGNLWDVPVYVAERLAEDEVIAFNAGSHTELIQMSYTDFEQLVKPTVITITRLAM
ncbi:MAG: YbaK/EbsC family protein [Phycisphaerales bacterium]|nr:MAG: YbaK/EbsC family protein [Phycisphaerales bacterium]